MNPTPRPQLPYLGTRPNRPIRRNRGWVRLPRCVKQPPAAYPDTRADPNDSQAPTTPLKALHSIAVAHSSHKICFKRLQSQRYVAKESNSQCSVQTRARSTQLGSLIVNWAPEDSVTEPEDTSDKSGDGAARLRSLVLPSTLRHISSFKLLTPSLHLHP